MSDISLKISIKEENNHLFKRCIRKLLESTFILREKDGKLYQFVSRESNRQDISEYLRMIGFDIILEEKTGVCMLIASEEDADTVGLKRANVVTFTTLQYHLLLVLWKVYLENLGYSEGNFVTKGDLIDKIKSYEIQILRPELNAALRLFKKYSLINYNEDDSGEDMKIQLYPSLQFGWDLPQFQTVAGEYLKDPEETSAEEEKSEGARGYEESGDYDGFEFSESHNASEDMEAPASFGDTEDYEYPEDSDDFEEEDE
ncbi:MAG: DUF4194 domain-containing protein [Lachnospiraceae bacterium]|nr:DUF4194 domain-containing protein [Lachnospiraceae bacterium]